MSRKVLSIGLVAAVCLSVFAAAPAEAKKKKKKKPPAACATFVPGELGAGSPTVMLTDAATEAAPVISTVSLGMSGANLDLVGTGAIPPETAFFNVQVDSSAPEVGIYMKLEFDPNRDYDLWLLYAADSSIAGSAHEWNTAYLPGVGYAPGLSGNGSHGNESSATQEAVLGIKVPDCGGHTVQVDNYFGEGGDMDVSLWLGPVVLDPLPVGQEFHP